MYHFVAGSNLPRTEGPKKHGSFCVLYDQRYVRDDPILDPRQQGRSALQLASRGGQLHHVP